jgi:predicted TIM-barrel fold metal-dependent hydrolase
MVRDEPVVLARITPFMAGATPPNDKVYYPAYAKCIDLDLPIAINTGLPGPPMPGACQDPMHLDEVCVFFPELKLVMAHGADPWWDVAIRLMIKYRNLYMQTSAYAPKYFPPQLIQFMNTRGQDKIMFASDHPVLSFERCIAEAQALDLREGVLDKFLYANADGLFFPGRRPSESRDLARQA